MANMGHHRIQSPAMAGLFLLAWSGHEVAALAGSAFDPDGRAGELEFLPDLAGGPGLESAERCRGGAPDLKTNSTVAHICACHWAQMWGG
jgi:hypothetical protein